MDAGGAFILFIFLIGVGFVVSFFVDDNNLRSYIESKGGRLLRKQWEPFGPGWFGEKNDRIYRIVYKDGEGNVHEAHAKTSLFSGVYLRDDRVIRPSPQSRQGHVPKREELERLREENRRLREALRKEREDPSV